MVTAVKEFVEELQTCSRGKKGSDCSTWHTLEDPTWQTSNLLEEISISEQMA
jgi:hypothetical protein